MRSSNIIILLIFIAAVAGGGFLLYNNKDKLFGKEPADDNTPDTAKDKTNTPPIGYSNPNAVSRANAGVKELQKQLNSKLPDTYPKLIEDGIWGPKTQAAFDFMNKQDDLGNLNIDTSQFVKKYKQVTDYAFNKTPLKYTPMANTYNAVKDVTKWAGDKLKRWL